MKKQKYYFAAVCWACLLSPVAWGADLLEVYQTALIQDAKFAAAQAEYLAGQEKKVQGLAGLLPQIGVSANSTWNEAEVKINQQSQSFDSDYNSNSYMVQMTQPLFRWQNWMQYQQGELQTALAEIQLDTARQDVILRVAKAYFDILNAEDALDAVVELRMAAAEQRALAEKSFDVGTVTITDVYESQSRLDLATSQEIAARNELNVRREALGQIIGHVPALIAKLRKNVTLHAPQPDSLTEWAAAAEQSNFLVQSKQLLREIAIREVEKMQAGHLPTVDLVASHGINKRMSLTANRMEATTIGVQLNVPIYSGGETSSRVREAAALKIKADEDLVDARRSAAQSARESYLGVTSGLAQVKALEAARLSSALSLEANKLGYEVGARINIDVLNAQSQLAETQKQLANARYTTLLSQLQLKAATGSLGEKDVREVNALLDQH